MLARVRSGAVLGIDAYVVEVETDIVKGLPSFATVGLPHGAVDLEQVAAQACLSKYHLSRLFRRIVGMPYQDYLTRIRIEEAKQLLVQTPYLSLTRPGNYT